MAKILKAENIQTDLLGSNGNNAFSLQRNSSSLLTLYTNDYVGVNTTAPSHLFEVRGSSTPKICITSDDQLIDQGATFRIDLKNASNSLFEAGTISVRHITSNQTAAAESSYMSFFTRNAGAVAEKMRILNTGSVGIGTTNPATKLHIGAGSIRMDDGYSLSWGGTANGVLGSNASNYLRFSTNGAVAMVIDNNGDVGIGTTNPARLLTVDNATSPEIGLYTAGTERVKFSTNGSAQSVLAIDIGGTPRFIIDSSGNVNIGSESVNTLRYLDVTNGNTGANAGSILRLITSNAAGSGNTTVDIVKYKNGQFAINNNDTNAAAFTSFNVGASERLRIDSSGNVGIGTTSISGKLHVYSASASDVLVRFGPAGISDGNFITTAKNGVAGATDGTPQFSLGMDYSTTYTDLAAVKFARGGGAQGNILFYTGSVANGTERLRIASAGQIGIGGANYGTSGQVLTSGGSAAAPSWSTNPVGFRNRIINGDMRIWQRGTTISNPTSSNFYTADRWGVNRNSDVSGATVSRDISGLSGFEYCLKLQRTAGNTNTGSLSLWYSNESTNTYDLAGSPVTLSFWVKTGANYSGGVLNAIIYSGTGTDQRVYAYTGAAAVINTTQAITSTWTRYTFTGTVPANSTELGLQISFTPTGTAGADDSVYITGVQLEAGSTATDFERRPIGTELALCQRYFQKTYDVDTAQATATNLGMAYVGSTTTGVYGLGGVQYVSNMRSIPAIRYWDGAGNENKCSYIVNNSASTSFVANTNLASAPYNISTRGFLVGANVVANSASYIHYTANSEL
jgi:hypothetical protein